jgi:hypothetical protein
LIIDEAFTIGIISVYLHLFSYIIIPH